MVVQEESLGEDDFFMLETILRTMQDAKDGGGGVLGAVANAITGAFRGGASMSDSDSAGAGVDEHALAGSAMLSGAANVASTLDDEDMLASLVLPGSPNSQASSDAGYTHGTMGAAT